MATITELQVQRVPIDSVTEHPDNARRGDLDVIRESLRTHGQYVPIVVQLSTGHVIKGNHTHRAAKAEGRTDIDVVFVDVDDDQAKRIMVMDNRASDRAEDDPAQLANLLQSLGGDLTGTGYSADDLTSLLATLDPAPSTDPYARPSDGSVLAMHDVSLGEPQHETHRGDVWKLGPVTHDLIDGKPGTTSGPHFLHVCSLAQGWPAFVPHLTEGALLLPYPGPYLPVTLLGLQHACVFVQPDAYLAGHLLDKWTALFPGTAVKVEAS